MIPSLAALRRSIDLVGMPMTILDVRGRIVHVNPANEQLLGRSADELRGRSIVEILPPDLQGRVPALLATVLREGRLHGVFENVRSDATNVPVEVTAEVICSARGKPRWIVASIRDLGPLIRQLEQLNTSALGLTTFAGEDFLVTTIRVARTLLGARYAALGVVEAGRLVRFIPDGMTEALIAAIDHWPGGHGLLGAMITGRRTIRLAELGADPRSAGFPEGHPPMRSFLGTPIQADDQVFGHLYFTDKLDAPEFSFVDERLAELFAAHAAIAIRDHRRRLALEASERSLAEAQKIAHIGSWDWDLATDRVRWSDEHCRIFGIEPGAFGGTNASFLAFVHPDDRAAVIEADRPSREWGAAYDLTHRIVRPDGSIRTVHEVGEVVQGAVGDPVRVVGTVEDITERVAAEEERARLVSAVEQTADSIVIHHLDGTIAYVNPSFSRLYGYASDETLGLPANFLDSGRHGSAFWSELWASVTAGRTWTGSIMNRVKDGSLVEVASVISPVHDPVGRLTGYVQTDRDVTRERELEGALERDARERETIEAALERIDPAASPEEIATAACAEIVRLPGIDSAWAVELADGHGRVLAAEGRIAQALVTGQPIPDAWARHLIERASGGGWTEVWRLDPEDGRFGDRISATGLQTLASAPLKGAQGVRGVIAFGIHDSTNPERLIERLPALATFASIVGALVAPGLETRQRQHNARASIQAILDQRAYRPFFQPIVELHTGAVVGYESLSRFSDGRRPDLVFALAAQAGLGIELETDTLAAAIAAATILPPAAYLSLNASPALIGSGALQPILAGLERPLVLEITEHVVIDDYVAIRRDLKALGPSVRLAVDDAGAGYSSLRHILELGPDAVKLDSRLVRGIDADPARQALIAGIAYFALKRKVRLIAEGIETRAELETLKRLAVSHGQGYLLGRPRDGQARRPWPATIAIEA